jgi:hypothetical protein
MQRVASDMYPIVRWNQLPRFARRCPDVRQSSGTTYTRPPRLCCGGRPRNRHNDLSGRPNAVPLVNRVLDAGNLLAVVGDSVWDMLAARRARALGIGVLSGERPVMATQPSQKILPRAPNHGLHSAVAQRHDECLQLDRICAQFLDNERPALYPIHLRLQT